MIAELGADVGAAVGRIEDDKAAIEAGRRRLLRLGRLRRRLGNCLGRSLGSGAEGCGQQRNQGGGDEPAAGAKCGIGEGITMGLLG